VMALRRAREAAQWNSKKPPRAEAHGGGEPTA
jgi:hypothetical protein